MLSRQIEVRKNTVAFSPLQSLDDALPLEYQKGEISGIYLTANLLPLQIEALKVEIENRQTQEDKEEA
jgi:hypothetical protein